MRIGLCCRAAESDKVPQSPSTSTENIDIQHSMLPIGRDDLAVAITEETWKAVSGVRGDDERMRGKRRADDERTDDSTTGHVTAEWWRPGRSLVLE